MKLSLEEEKTITALRELDPQQRENIIAYINRQLLANKITERVAGMPAIVTVPDRKVARAFGVPTRTGNGRLK